MPNYVRWRQSGASYFFTVVTYRRRRLFDSATARKLLQQAMVHTRRRFPFDMFGGWPESFGLGELIRQGRDGSDSDSTDGV